MAILVVGIGMLWLVPAAGCLFIVTAGLGLAISSETELAQAAVPTAIPVVAQATEGAAGSQ